MFTCSDDATAGDYTFGSNLNATAHPRCGDMEWSYLPWHVRADSYLVNIPFENDAYPKIPLLVTII
jgi:hypothetical protein